jgi:hypothetical protein
MREDAFSQKNIVMGKMPTGVFRRLLLSEYVNHSLGATPRRSSVIIGETPLRV